MESRLRCSIARHSRSLMELQLRWSPEQHLACLINAAATLLADSSTERRLRSLTGQQSPPTHGAVTLLADGAATWLVNRVVTSPVDSAVTSLTDGAVTSLVDLAWRPCSNLAHRWSCDPARRRSCDLDHISCNNPTHCRSNDFARRWCTNCAHCWSFDPARQRSGDLARPRSPTERRLHSSTVQHPL